MEISYLFSVRYLHVHLADLEGVLGTPAVLIGVGAVVALQLVFTYAPFMQAAVRHPAGGLPGRSGDRRRRRPRAGHRGSGEADPAQASRAGSRLNSITECMATDQIQPTCAA